MNQLLFGLLDTPIARGSITVSDESSIDSLNQILIKCGAAVGAIIIAIAAIKMIWALADENAANKQQASMIFGVGIVFVSISAVLDVLDITSTTTGNTVAGNILTVIGTMLSYSGAILLMLGIISLIMSIVSEQPEQKANGIKLITTSIGFLSVRGLCGVLKTYIGQSNSKSATSWVSVIVGFITNVATYAGGGLIIIGVYYLIMSIREEQSKDREVALRFFMAGISLVSLRFILENYFGFENLMSTFSL